MNNMKKMSVLFAFLLALIMIFAQVPHTVKAAEDPYSYTIRVFAGEQGTINGGTVYEVTVAAGDRFTFNMNSVQENAGSKYTRKGIRESGKDNAEALNALSFVVNQDQDYVVAYGITGKMVAYTVNYVDAATGEALAPADTFYAADGERPVAGYRYFENYTPRYYNITGTVRAGQENSWTFLYDAVETETPAPTPTPAPAEGEGAAAEGEGAAAAEGEAAAPAAVPAAPEAVPAAPGAAEGEAVAPGGEAAPGTVTPGGAGTEGQEGTGQPQEIIDIDEQEVPLASNETTASAEETTTEGQNQPTQGGEGNIWSTIGIIGGGVIVAGLIALIIGLVVGRKKKQD